VIILDPTLLGTVNCTDGLKPDGFVIINTNKSPDDLKKLFPQRNIAAVDASTIAKEEMGVPITNTTMLGSLIKATEIVNVESLGEPIQDRFGKIAQKNVNAYKRAHTETTIIKKQ
jgi:pyruvate ferredoxin oxidoreductase gamma subunit